MRSAPLAWLVGVLLSTGCGRTAAPSHPPGPAASPSPSAPTHDPKSGKERLPVGDREEKEWWVGETVHFGITVQKGSGNSTTTSTDHARLQELKSRMELLYGKYALAFGLHSRPEKKASLKLYLNKAAYQAAGGPPGSAAYYSPRTQELVAFEDGRDGAHVFQVLCHEGCHQFFDLSFPGFYERPDFPMWFSEGLADCFGASEIRGGELFIFTLSGLARGRIEVIKKAVFAHAHPSLKQLLEMNRAAFMGDADLHYAMSWSLVHFLWNAPSLDSGNGTYHGVVVRLIEGLKAGGSGEMLAREAFQVKGKPIDMDRLEKEWEAYVKTLKAKK